MSAPAPGMVGPAIPTTKANNPTSPEVRDALEKLSILQPMISLSAERLEGLRTQCSTSAEITQQEIRTLEGKLIKLFSQQLVAKKRIPAESLPATYQGLPSLQLWLQVVGLASSLSHELCTKVSSLESLKEKPESEIKALMNENSGNDEDIRRLTRALHNLKRYMEVVRNQQESGLSTASAFSSSNNRDDHTGSLGQGQGQWTNGTNGPVFTNSGSTCSSATTNGDSNLSDLYWDSWDMSRVGNNYIDYSSTSGSSSPHSSSCSRNPHHPHGPPTGGGQSNNFILTNNSRSSRNSVPSDSDYSLATSANLTNNNHNHTGNLSSSSTSSLVHRLHQNISGMVSSNSSHNQTHRQQYMHSCSTTPCTPVTTVAPASLTSPAFSPGSHPEIYSPTNSSVFSPSSAATSPGSYVDSSTGLTPPTTPPVKGKDKKFPTTPPIRSKKHQRVCGSSDGNGTCGSPTTPIIPHGSLQADNFLLTKSKSHESQLGNKIESVSETNLASLHNNYSFYSPKSQGARTMGNIFNFSGSFGYAYSLDQLPSKAGRTMRDRLPTEPGPGSGWADSVSGSIGTASSLVSSPIKSPPLNSYSENEDGYAGDSHRMTLQVPKSPRTPNQPRSMGHMISHRFSKMLKVATCDYCDKQMFYGVKCKECKYKCHRDCEAKVPPSCGLPREYIDFFVKSQQEGDSPILNPNRNSPLNWVRNRKYTKPPQNIHVQSYPGHDSSSNTSSCNSSTPSSPALFANTNTSAPVPSPASATLQSQRLFDFPGIESYYNPSKGNSGTIHSISDSSSSFEPRSVIGSLSSDITSTQKSNDSDRTVSQTSGSGSTDSEKTLALKFDSQDSQVSDFDGDSGERNWPRQNSLSNREWDIPFDELKLGEKIGTGHFGTVYRGNWHGDVAIKLLDVSYLDNEKTLEQFKHEVGIFRKTRHENLILFMGACMKPPRLAIVTSMCKGLSLFTHLHLRRDKFNINKTVLIAQQISNGMSYLHARGIIHKDLKTKNIFLESGRVVITDFGLFSVTKLCHGTRNKDSISIPPGWLCYVAPELLKSLSPGQKHDSELPFSKGSDVYAFGTVWYELLVGEWPYKDLIPESIIWQVGSGIRQPLPTLFSRDVKEIIVICWSPKPQDRPDFGSLVKALEKLPKKRLARSPSHPIHLSRSAESVF